MKDATSRNALAKFDSLISKKFEKQLELEEEELRKLEELQDLFEFLDDIIPEDDGELIDPEPKRRGRKRFVVSCCSPLSKWLNLSTLAGLIRRSVSVASTTTDGETPSHDSGRGKPRAKK